MIIYKLLNMNFLLYLNTKDTKFCNGRFSQYPHEKDYAEGNLINDMFEVGFFGLYEKSELKFEKIYDDFLGSVNSQGGQKEAKRVEVSEERKCRLEKMSENEFEELKKKLAKKCSNKEKCGNCYIEKGDCPLLHGWKKEEGGDKYTYSYKILGEYLPDLKKVVLYVKNIDDACGKPTYNGVLSTYIHELFHAYFHYFTEHHNKAEYNYIKEVEEAMTEFSTLVFLRVMEKLYDGSEWSEIFEWTMKSIGEKQETVGDLPAYGFGRYLFDNIPEDEAFEWINKYAERLGYIDEEDEFVKQYKQMVYPCYPSDPDKCLELLRKILFETNNKPIKPSYVKGNCFKNLTIEYPTLDLLEEYLGNYFNSSISLGTCVASTGRKVGHGEMCLLPAASIPGEDITGIDIPVLIPACKSDRTIMIIEQDPLRNPKEFSRKYSTSELRKNAIVGTPNALHSGKPVCFYLELVGELTKLGWNVYLTDAFKIYAPGLRNKKGRCGLFEKKLLEAEIKRVRPQLVLLFGSKAQEAYASVSKAGIIEVKLPHRSARASVWYKYNIKPATDANKLRFVLNSIP